MPRPPLVYRQLRPTRIHPEQVCLGNPFGGEYHHWTKETFIVFPTETKEFEYRKCRYTGCDAELKVYFGSIRKKR